MPAWPLQRDPGSTSVASLIGKVGFHDVRPTIQQSFSAENTEFP
jgi:hypothetical protein